MLLRHVVLKLALLGTVLAFATAAGAQTDKAAVAVQAMIDSLGGKAFTAVSELQSSGTVFTFRGDRRTGSSVFIDYVKFPDKKRVELGTYRIKPTQINNGNAGWTINDKNIDPQSPAETKEFQIAFHTGFQYVAHFVLTRPGLSLLLAGTELVDFKRNDVIEFRDAGTFFRLFIDQKSHLPTKMEIRRTGESFVREEQFANWHTFQGIQTPLYVIYFEDGEKTKEVRYDNVRYNSGLADSLFSPPGNPAAK